MRPRLFFVLSHVFKVLSYSAIPIALHFFRSWVRGTGINYCNGVWNDKKFFTKSWWGLTRTRCCTVRSPLVLRRTPPPVLRIVKPARLFYVEQGSLSVGYSISVSSVPTSSSNTGYIPVFHFRQFVTSVFAEELYFNLRFITGVSEIGPRRGGRGLQRS
jgi:hypothetical protein